LLLECKNLESGYTNNAYSVLDSTPQNVIQNCNTGSKEVSGPGVLDIIDKLAWPVVILIICIIFHKKIKLLISKLIEKIDAAKEINIGKDGLRLISKEFDEFTEKVADQELIRSISFGSILDVYKLDQNFLKGYFHVDQLNSLKNLDKVSNLLKIHPRSAILEFWVTFELYIFENYQHLIIDDKKNIGPMQLLEVLKGNALINKNELEALTEMRILRNKIAHSHIDVSSDLAARYIDIGIKLLRQLNQKKLNR
jgi:hypothetical protein